MNGIEILATEEVATEYIFNWTACLIAAGAILGFFVILGIVVSITSCDWFNVTIGCILGIIFSVVFGIVTGDITSIPTEYETQYKVVISDEIKMNEFSENYEIVNQDGKIYTIRERNLVDDYDE